jgi:hypothetical protein
MTSTQAILVYSFKTQEETMDTQKVSFKVVLNSQIRRFTIAQDKSTSLNYLKEKLSTMFVNLHQKDFRYMFVSVVCEFNDAVPRLIGLVLRQVPDRLVPEVLSGI